MSASVPEKRAGAGVAVACAVAVGAAVGAVVDAGTEVEVG